MASHYVSQAVVISILLSINVLASARILPSGHGGDKANDVRPQDYFPGTCAAVITPQGYNCQEFEVQTQDGFILGLQNIPVGRNPAGSGPRTPVLLQHGVTGDGVTWLVSPPQQSLAYILADSGYDVWIANGRGTRMSSGHVSYLPESLQYWDWSWDEIVANDLPAMVDFIYQKTGQKLHYVGHSQGTETVMAALSQGLLVDKLRSAALLCPVAYLFGLGSGTGLASVLAKSIMSLGPRIPGVSGIAGVHGIQGVPSPPKASNLSDLSSTLVGIPGLPGVGEFNPMSGAVAAFMNAACSFPGMNCYDMIAAITGPNCCLDSSTVGTFLQYEPQPTSMKNMIHLAQQATKLQVTKFDYGLLNFWNYRQLTPPEYNLQAIPTDFPLFLSYGGRDLLSNVVDVQRLLSVLGQHNVTPLYIDKYAHMDFIMAVDAKQNVYDSMITFFSQH